MKKKYYQRPDGLLEASRIINGKRVMFRGKTTREVERKMLAYQEEAEKGRKFPVVADEWERLHELEVSESSRKVYGYAVKRLKEAFPGYIRAIRPLDVTRYIRAFEGKGYHGNTVAIELSAMKQICSYAVLAGDIDVSPATEVKKSRGLPKNEREALTEEQENIIKQSGIDKTAPFWLFPYLLLYTGLRRGEALALNYSDVDRKAGVIHVTKKISFALGGSAPRLENHLKSENGARDVPLLTALAAALPKDKVGLIFPGEDGGFMTTTELIRNWREYCRAVELNKLTVIDEKHIKETFPITPHCLRHSYATICYEAGLDSRQAAKFLGDTVQTLEGVYTHLRKTHSETAAEKLEKCMSKSEATVS